MTTTLPFAIPDPVPFDSLISLKGRCAVVTGGSRGIGEAVVLRLVEAGASVVITGRGREALEQTEAKVVAMGGQAVGVQADAASVEDAQRVIDLAVGRFGGVDILVNNAAVFPGSLSEEVTEALWDETVDTDLKGAFFAAKFAANEMIKAGRGGRIINVLSTEIFRPTGLLVAYGAAKAGLMAVTKSMAKELGEYGILVNAVIPGATLTAERIAAMQSGQGPFQGQVVPPEAAKTQQMVHEALEKGNLRRMLSETMPLGRPGYPDDIAKAVLFMASELARYVSGTSLTVDGAQTLR